MERANYIQFADRIKIIRQMCDKLITEVQKEKPNELTISNILMDKIAKELYLAESIFYGFRPANQKPNGSVFIAVGVNEGKTTDSLLENEYRGCITGTGKLNIPGEHIALSR